MVVTAGVDVGKASLDVSISEGSVIRFDNTVKGIGKLLKHLRNMSPPWSCVKPPAGTSDYW